MKARFKLKAFAAAMALLATGSAFAQTSITAGTGGADGSLFLNVVDTSNNSSYTLDLSAAGVYGSGAHINEFTGTASLTSFNLTTDTNWNNFLAATSAGDSIQYDVLAVKTNASANSIDLTSNAGNGSGVTNSQLKNISGINSFINAVNSSTNTSTISLFATAANNDAAYFGDSSGVPATLPITLANLGTALNFYNLTNNGTSNLTHVTSTQFAGTWLLTSAGALSYQVSAVPLPKSWALLLSGLALMGVITRRGKSSNAAEGISGAAA